MVRAGDYITWPVRYTMSILFGPMKGRRAIIITTKPKDYLLHVLCEIVRGMYNLYHCLFYSLNYALPAMSTSDPRGPFKLVTVNTAPERAKRLIGQVAQALSDRYVIIHAANCESESIYCTLCTSACLTIIPTSSD
jgi:hypothetical protein